MITQTYNLNLIPSSAPLVVHCSRYDKNSRTLSFNIFDGDLLYSIPNGTLVTIRGTKPDKTGFSYSCTFEDSIVSVDIQEQMTVVSGDVECEIRLTNGDEILGTANFILRVERSALADDTVISETDLPAVENAEQYALRAEAAALETENKMNYVSNPQNNKVLYTDENGQAQMSDVFWRLIVEHVNGASVQLNSHEIMIDVSRTITINKNDIISDSTYTEYSYKYSFSWGNNSAYPYLLEKDYVDCNDEIDGYTGAYALESQDNILNFYFSNLPTNDLTITVIQHKIVNR